MIIQRVVKGISGITEDEARGILRQGIICRWWQQVGSLPAIEVPQRLTDRNLAWHQNRYEEADPLENGEAFSLHTPYISTTAGTVERDVVRKTNVLHPAWEIGLRFATNFWQGDGYLFYCYVFTLSRKAVGHQPFAEEVRELNVYAGYSPYQVEGEMVAKIQIPPAQIEKAEFWAKDEALAAARARRIPTPDPARVLYNNLFVDPSEYNNVRDVLS
jgi:hypothetical protein